MNKRRTRLLKRVDAFNARAYDFLPREVLDDFPEVPDVDPEESQFLALLDEDEPDIAEPFVLPAVSAENKLLALPAMLQLPLTDASKALRHKELTLRQGQANDALQGLRSALGEKSFLFRQDLRLADSKIKKTCSWTRVTGVNKKLNYQRWVYTKARRAMVTLGADAALLKQYQVLKREDLRVSIAIMTPNAPGQRNVSLAWFWNLDLGVGAAHGDDNLLTECTYNV